MVPIEEIPKHQNSVLQKRHRISVAVYNGWLAFEYAIAAELLGLVRPGLEDIWYDFQPCRVESGDLISNQQTTLKPRFGRSRIIESDTVLIPGWRNPKEKPKPAFLNAVTGAYENGARIVSICTGAFVLGYAGILDGQRATTHWLHAEYFRQCFPKVELVSDALYIHDGRVSTSAGSAAGLDLCLSLIRKDFGIEVANTVSRRMVAPMHREGGQSQFEEPVLLNSMEGEFGMVLDWMMRHLDEPISIRQIAKKFSMSLRTFHRRFQDVTGLSPLAWISKHRILNARNMLEATDLTIEEISIQTGLGSAMNLRKHFFRELGVTPSTYRSSFRDR